MHCPTQAAKLSSLHLARAEDQPLCFSIQSLVCTEERHESSRSACVRTWLKGTHNRKLWLHQTGLPIPRCSFWYVFHFTTSLCHCRLGPSSLSPLQKKRSTKRHKLKLSVSVLTLSRNRRDSWRNRKSRYVSDSTHPVTPPSRSLQPKRCSLLNVT